jgi:pyruvate kinase
MAHELLCTLGPSSLNERVITRLEALGASLFRLNLSHTKVADAARIIRFVQQHTSVPLSLDTEGAQIRTGDLVGGSIRLRENSLVRARRQRVPGDAREFNLYPLNIIARFRVGDVISVDADVLLQVIDLEPEAVVARVLTGGSVGSNKAVTVERDIALPALTQKDRVILAIGKELGILDVALSFAHRPEDVDEIRQAAGAKVSVISKIECREGLRNLREIAERSDAILIDRGDLSREVPLEQMPRVQKYIIQSARELERKVYVATNLMESMTTSPVPTRAEVNDVFNTLMDGASGLVLAAETAIGSYPIGCASMLVRIMREFEDESSRPVVDRTATPISLLVDPHGGRLVQRIAEPETSQSSPSRTIEADAFALDDCEQLGHGAYSPLAGFLGREELESVLEHHRLPDGTVWPMPVLLPLDTASAGSTGAGETIHLLDARGRLRASVQVSEIFRFDPESLAARWYGTTAREHPGVARLLDRGDHFAAGEVTWIEHAEDSARRYRLTPRQTREVFARKGWDRVVAFATRNVPHRVHEFVQRGALESTHADGLFLSLVCGPSRPGAFREEVVLEAYQLLLDFGRYPAGRVVLGQLSDYPRFAGARGALFQALRYKNMGCSHVVIGPRPDPVRGVGAHDATQELFEAVGDVGVKPVFFDELGYDPASESYTKRGAGIASVRSRDVRQALTAGEVLPPWKVDPLVADSLRSLLDAGRPLFHEHDDGV